jgi:hypothetical protein
MRAEFHRINSIPHDYHLGSLHAFWLKMDCPAQPDKIVVLDTENCPTEPWRTVLQVRDYFDPDFSNKVVVAHFSPDLLGWRRAVNLVTSLAQHKGT